MVAADARLVADARTFAADLARIVGYELPVVVGTPATGDLAVRLGDDVADDEEAYTVVVGDSVVVAGRSVAGVSRGTQTVEQLLTGAGDAWEIPRGTIADWPRVADRGVMLDIGRKYYDPATIEQLIRQAAWYKLNTIHLHFTEWNAFRLNSPRFPGLAPPESYVRDDIARFERAAATYHVAIVPEIDLPSHATPITAYWPETTWPCAPMNDERGHNYTVDVTKPVTRKVVKELLDEFVPWFRGSRFHIGADEYPYQSTQERCPSLVAYAKENGFANTSDVIVDFIDYLNSIVRAHGKRAQAWGWWDAAGTPTRKPDRNIVVEAYGDNEFAGGAAGVLHLLEQGYDVLYADGNQLYVTPGLDLLPDNARLYASWPGVNHPRLLGYMVSRWSDEKETESDAYHDWYAHRAQQVLADRAWGGPPAASHLDYEDRVDRIGPPPGVTFGSAAVTGNARRITGTPFGAAGIDAGQPVPVVKTRVLPSNGSPARLERLVGTRVQGRTEEPGHAWTDLATIPWQPPGYDWIQLPVRDPGRYRWLRCVSPDGGPPDIERVEFYTGG